MYLLKRKFKVETDHKPLVPLLGHRHLDSLPPRVRLRLARFNDTIEHVPSKNLWTADALSRAPLSAKGDSNLEQLAMEACIAHLPAGQQQLSEFEKAQHSDPFCSPVLKYCCTSWPGKIQVSDTIAPYWEARSDLTLHGNLLLHGTRIVIPASKQQEILQKIHSGHRGIQRCRERAKMSVWWPGRSRQIEEFVKNCPHCVKESTPLKEPLMPSTLPEYPWQRIGTDQFLLNRKTHTYRIRLLFTLPRSCDPLISYFTQCHHSPEIGVRSTWHSTGVTTDLNVPLENLHNLPHNQQSSLSTE